jgi:hypothetical protein
VTNDRRALFWIFAILTTLLYLFFLLTALTVPGITPATRVGMFLIVAATSLIALAIGVWRPTTTDAPGMDSRLSAVMCVFLALEFLHSGTSLLILALK